jgi:hypothetical protein
VVGPAIFCGHAWGHVSPRRPGGSEDAIVRVIGSIFLSGMRPYIYFIIFCCFIFVYFFKDKFLNTYCFKIYNSFYNNFKI